MSASYILFSQQHPFARAWDSFPGEGSRPTSSVSRRSSVKLNWRILSGNEIIEGRNDDSCVRFWIGEREKIGLFEAGNGCCCFGFEGSMEKVSNLNFDKV